MPESTEHEARVPGWTLIRTGKSNNYRAPDGSVIGDWAYRKVYRHYQSTGEAVESPINYKPNRGTNKAAETIDFSSPESSTNVNDIPLQKPYYPNTVDSKFKEPVNEIKMPSSKPTSVSKGDRFSAKDISIAIQTLLVMLTSFAALASRLPEAQMTEQECKAIGIPLANLIERSKYNVSIGRLVVGKGDYILLGYALYAYVDRVAEAGRQRANGQSTGLNQQDTQSGQGSNGNIVAPGGAALHYAPGGLRRFTPDTQQ